MELDFSFNVGSNDRNREHIGEIFGQSGRVDTLNFAASKLSQRAKTVKVALVSFDRDDVDSDTSSVGDLTNTLIELLGSSRICLCAALIECTKADVCETICADDNRGASGSLGSHRDRSQDTGAKSRWACLFDSFKFSFEAILSLTNRLSQALSCLGLTIVLEILKVVQVIASDGLRTLGCITDHLHFVVKGHDTNLAFTGAICHVSDLGVNSCLHALDTRDISHAFVRLVHKLVRSITKCAHLLGKRLQVISFDFMFTLNRLTDAHRS